MPHKSDLQRSVMAARSQVDMARHYLDQKPLSIPELRKALDESLETLGRLELMVKKESRGGNMSMLAPKRVERTLKTDDNRWMLNTFTQYDFDITDINYKIQVQASDKSGDLMPFAATREGSTVTLCSSEMPQNLSGATADILSRWEQPDFDFLGLSSTLLEDQKQIPIFANHYIETGGGLERMATWIDDKPQFHCTYLKFLSAIEGKYDSNVLYHNAKHAVDVMSTVARLMQCQYLQSETTALDRLLVLTTAACHDVGHKGTDNLFHIRTSSSLAIRYNDTSILESMHAAETFEVMQKNDRKYDWLRYLVDDMTREEGIQRGRNKIQQYVRRAMVRMILGTDMAKHEKFMKDLGTFVLNAQRQAEQSETLSDETEAPEGKSREEALENKLFLLETVVHAADLSGPTKPHPIMLALTNRVMNEFWSQGEDELRIGLEVSPMCNKATGILGVPGSQLFFSSRIVQPLWLQINELMPETRELSQQLEENLKFWEEKKGEQATYDQLFPSGRASIRR